MSSRSWLFLVTGLLAAVLVTLIGFLTPWQILSVPIHQISAANDFTTAELNRAKTFHSSLIPWGVGSWAVSLIAVGLLGFTSFGFRLLSLIPGPALLRTFLGVLAIESVINIVQLPFDVEREKVLRIYGLSTQRWVSWLVERVQHFAIGACLTGLGLVAFAFCARTFGQRWWLVGGAGAALLVVIVSFGYPLVFEPIFNKFTPMAPSVLRDDLMAMAAHDGVPVKQILIADASKRTTALNAYVSGFGATRRIVLYDVLLSTASPTEVKLVVAHELGHAKVNDVGRYTLVGALSSALGVGFIGLFLGWAPLLKRAGFEPSSNPITDPRGVAAILALIAFFTLAQQPISTLISRHIEARADVHALNLTRDANGFVEMQRTLAISNLSDPNPNTILFWLFGTHPTAPERIGIARAWAKVNGQIAPLPLANR